jgi:hypothetical protein
MANMKVKMKMKMNRRGMMKGDARTEGLRSVPHWGDEVMLMRM